MKTKIYSLFLTILLMLPTLAWAANDEASSDSTMMDYLRDKRITITEGNRVCVLKSGGEKFDDLFTAIRKAKHYVHLEYFNFRNDSIAALLFTELEKKVKEGVKVRAMFDAFGNWSNNLLNCLPKRGNYYQTMRFSFFLI